MENQENSASTVETPKKEQRVYGGHNANTDIGSFFNRNKKLVTYGGAILAILLVGIIAYRYYAESQNKLANVDIFKAQRLWEADSFRMALQGDPTMNAMGLEDVADEYGMTRNGSLAEYYIAIAYYNEGKYEDAIEHMKDFHTDSRIIGPMSMGVIGDAYSQLKNYDKAASYYMDAAKDNDNQFTTPYFYKKAGLVYEELKEYDKASDVYQIIKDKYKTSQEGREIDKYLGRAKFASEAKK